MRSDKTSCLAPLFKLPIMASSVVGPLIITVQSQGASSGLRNQEQVPSASGQAVRSLTFTITCKLPHVHYPNQVLRSIGTNCLGNNGWDAMSRLHRSLWCLPWEYL